MIDQRRTISWPATLTTKLWWVQAAKRIAKILISFAMATIRYSALFQKPCIIDAWRHHSCKFSPFSRSPWFLVPAVPSYPMLSLCGSLLFFIMIIHTENWYNETEEQLVETMVFSEWKTLWQPHKSTHKHASFLSRVNCFTQMKTPS